MVSSFSTKGTHNPIFTFYLQKVFSLVSHIVTIGNQSKCCPRTLKFLFGVASGKWIVDFQCKLAYLNQYLFISIIVQPVFKKLLYFRDRRLSYCTEMGK